MASQGFVRIGTILVPYPDYESGLQTTTTLVDGSRNQYGVFIGQRIGRDQSKIELQWTRMDIATWTAILQAFDASFVLPVQYYDMSKGAVLVRKMYVNDRTAQPDGFLADGMSWAGARNCKLNLIDTGA